MASTRVFIGYLSNKTDSADDEIIRIIANDTWHAKDLARVYLASRSNFKLGRVLQVHEFKRVYPEWAEYTLDAEEISTTSLKIHGVE